MAEHSSNPSMLFYGYGNPSRGDDGLGIALAERLEALRTPYVSVEENYQLHPEDALLCSKHDIVIFADATKNAIDTFSFYPLLPALEIAFTTHAMHPSSVYALCQQLYSCSPDVYLLEIKGFNWDFTEGLSPDAKRNLDLAFNFILPLVKKPSIQQFRIAAGVS